jgi:hypothetical protein
VLSDRLCRLCIGRHRGALSTFYVLSIIDIFFVISVTGIHCATASSAGIANSIAQHAKNIVRELVGLIRLVEQTVKVDSIRAAGSLAAS